MCGHVSKVARKDRTLRSSANDDNSGEALSVIGNVKSCRKLRRFYAVCWSERHRGREQVKRRGVSFRQIDQKDCVVTAAIRPNLAQARLHQNERLPIMVLPFNPSTLLRTG